MVSRGTSPTDRRGVDKTAIIRLKSVGVAGTMLLFCSCRTWPRRSRRSAACWAAEGGQVCFQGTENSMVTIYWRRLPFQNGGLRLAGSTPSRTAMLTLFRCASTSASSMDQNVDMTTPRLI